MLAFRVVFEYLQVSSCQAGQADLHAAQPCHVPRHPRLRCWSSRLARAPTDQPPAAASLCGRICTLSRPRVALMVWLAVCHRYSGWCSTHASCGRSVQTSGAYDSRLALTQQPARHSDRWCCAAVHAEPRGDCGPSWWQARMHAC
jgi:hypothetical protein